MGTPTDLRIALAAELTAPELNSDRIAELAAALVESDPTRARFSVDAGMLARLGRELVARHETALSELVKNAYDADARRVAVRIASPLKGNYIEVADDGSGMTHEAFVKGFMRLATNDKIESPVSPEFKRRRAGRKGIGRLAAERLGERLILTTATDTDESALRMEINWDNFAPGRELSSISIPVSSTRKPRPHGTTLRVERLRDNWSRSAIERTFEHVTELLDIGDQTKSGATTGAEFNVTFSGDGQEHNIVDFRSQVAGHAYATIEAEIDKDGGVTWGLSCPALKIDVKKRSLRVGENEANTLEFARQARMKVQYYILESRYFPPTVFRTVQKYLATNGGVRVYRNGFRVPPYGQRGDDWLSLDLLSSQRTRILAPVRNRNFLGSVSLNDDSGLFEETSSREGLIGSAAFDELVKTMHSAIVTAVREIDAARGKAEKREQPSRTVYQEPDRVPTGAVAQAFTEAVRTIRTELGREVRVSPAMNAALERVTASAEEVARRARESDALLKEIDLLRVLASMGLAIGQFTHEFSTLSGAMRGAMARSW